MSFDPYAPYGAMLETTCRLVTWNVWGRYGEWAARLDGIIAELKRFAPDIVLPAGGMGDARAERGGSGGRGAGLAVPVRLG